MHKSGPFLGLDSPSAPECSPVIQAAVTFTFLQSWAEKQTSSSNLYLTSDLACLSGLITHSIRVALRGGDECYSVVLLCSGRAFSHCHPSSVCLQGTFFYLNLGSLYFIHPLNPTTPLFYSTTPWCEALKVT